jgi:UDP-glucose 4-epimerase
MADRKLIWPWLAALPMNKRGFPCAIGFRKFIISATTPFGPDDLAALRIDAPRVVRQRVPQYEAEHERREWKLFPSIDRVYVNERARKQLGWLPRKLFSEGPYPVE